MILIQLQTLNNNLLDVIRNMNPNIHLVVHHFKVHPCVQWQELAMKWFHVDCEDALYTLYC